MNFPALYYSQNSQDYIAAVLPFHIIKRLSKVVVYDKDEGGYQRQPQPIHYKKIAKYLIEKPKTFKLPTSIILGLDRKTADVIYNKELSVLDLEKEQEQIFRIVDGQHRIYGITEALKSNTNLSELQLNVIIIISEENRRSVELEIFKDINSKAKRINIDLATLATRDYELIENTIDKSEISKHIGWKIAYHLKCNTDSVWSYGIKFDIHSDIKLGIIGVSSFIDSIKVIIDILIRNSDIYDLSGDQLVKKCGELADQYVKYIIEIWDVIVVKKWNQCFDNALLYNDENELVRVSYNLKNYIQKPIGVKSIHKLFTELLKLNEGNFQNTIGEFRKMIEESDVKNKDWFAGGPFSGFNSEGGFSKIGQMIKNEIAVPRRATS